MDNHKHPVSGALGRVLGLRRAASWAALAAGLAAPAIAEAPPGQVAPAPSATAKSAQPHLFPRVARRNGE